MVHSPLKVKSITATLVAVVVLATGAFCPLLVLCVAGDHAEIELSVSGCCGREERSGSETQNRDCGACHDVSFEALVAGALHSSPSAVMAAPPAAIVASAPVSVASFPFLPTGESAAQILPGATPLSAALRC